MPNITKMSTKTVGIVGLIFRDNNLIALSLAIDNLTSNLISSFQKFYEIPVLLYILGDGF